MRRQLSFISHLRSLPPTALVFLSDGAGDTRSSQAKEWANASEAALRVEQDTAVAAHAESLLGAEMAAQEAATDAAAQHAMQVAELEQKHTEKLEAAEAVIQGHEAQAAELEAAHALKRSELEEQHAEKAKEIELARAKVRTDLSHFTHRAC